MKRAVVTGLGCVTPIGNNVTDFWEALIAGKNGAAPITQFNTTFHKTKFACEIKEFAPELYIGPAEIRKLDRYTQLALVATEMCIQHAKIDFSSFNRDRIGVIFASGMGGMITLEEEILDFGRHNQTSKFSPLLIPKIIPNIAAGHISIRHGLRGVSYATISACASSNHAIANALDLIRLGRAEVLVVGGSEAPISHASISGFNSMRALSTLNENPKLASRPFDQKRDGFVAAEGAGALLIEELEHAQNRGAKIYAELAGYGAASDAYHIATSHPKGTGAILAMKTALTDAGVLPDEVNYINAHATSTIVGDLSECVAIEKIFGNNPTNLIISATKSMTGHLLGAAGAVEAIACIKAMENSIVPPTINLNKVDSGINPNFNLTPNHAITSSVDIAINNTFGFGGHAVTTVFKKFEG